MYKYSTGVYQNSKDERISVVKIINSQGFIGYDVDLLDDNCKQLYNITEAELEVLIK